MNLGPTQLPDDPQPPAVHLVRARAWAPSGPDLAAPRRTAAVVLYWTLVCWGALAAVATFGLLTTGRWADAAVQALVAAVLLTGLPLGRAYQRRKAYHRALAARADLWSQS